MFCATGHLATERDVRFVLHQQFSSVKNNPDDGVSRRHAR